MILKIIKFSVTLLTILVVSGKVTAHTISLELNDGRTIELPKSFSNMPPLSQIHIAMGLCGEKYSLNLPIVDSASTYQKQLASALVGMKQVMSKDEYVNKTSFECRYEIKDVWLAYLYEVFDESYGDRVISPAMINGFIKKHSEYLEGKGTFPRKEFLELLKGPNYYWAVRTNHGNAPASFALELQYLMENGLAGLQSIKDVADIVSPDGKAGLISIESDYNDDYGQSIILIDSGKGIFCNMWHIDEKGYVQSNHYSRVLSSIDSEGERCFQFLWDKEDYSISQRQTRKFILKDGKIKEQK